MRATPVLLVLGALGASGTAHADDAYMWAIGPRLGTMVFPGAYPLLFPARVNTYDVNDDGETDVGPNGNEQHSDLEKVRGDVIFGGEGYYWLNKEQRIGAYAGLGAGTGFSDVNLVLKYDQMITGGGDVDVYIGGGLGFGSMTFKGLDNDGVLDPAEDAERLRINYFPARLEISPLFRFDTWGIQPKLWGGLNIPSSHRWTVDGEEIDGIQGTLFNYATFGIEAAVMFGDLKPPKKKKKGNNNNNNNNNNGRGNNNNNNGRGGGGRGGPAGVDRN